MREMKRGRLHERAESGSSSHTHNPLYYDWNNVVQMSIAAGRRYKAASRYRNYSSDGILLAEPNLVVDLGRIIPRLDGCMIIDDKYFVREDYFYCSSDSHGFIKWEVEIQGIEKQQPIRMRIRIGGIANKLATAPMTMIEGLLVDPAIHMILLKQGLAMIHASCISRDGNGVMIAGRGGAGKTSTSVEMLKHGFSLLSDNFTVLGESKTAFGFVEPFNLFSYNVGPYLRRRLRWKRRAEISAKDILHKATGRRIKIFTRVGPQELAIDTQKESQLEVSYLLIPSPQESIEIRGIPKEIMAAHLCYNLMLEFPHLSRYINAFSFLRPESDIANHWQTYLYLLRNRLPDHNYIIYVPEKLSEQSINTICEVIADDLHIQLQPS